MTGKDSPGKQPLDMDRYRHKVLEAFKVYDTFCRNYGLRYSVVSGALLGAVRHKGFIPWDDDIDVVMPRPDYNKFISLTLNGIAPGYEVQSVYSSPSWYFPFAKVMDANTTLLEKEDLTDCILGAYVDVFPLDGVPAEMRKRRKQDDECRKHISRLHTLIRTPGTFLGKVKKKVYMVLYSRRKEAISIENISQRYPFGKTRESKVFYGIYGDREVIDSSIYNEFIELPFEDTVIRSVAKYDYYLTRYFGDYMQLPPENQRVTHHSCFFADLERRISGEELKRILGKSRNR